MSKSGKEKHFRIKPSVTDAKGHHVPDVRKNNIPYVASRASATGTRLHNASISTDAKVRGPRATELFCELTNDEVLTNGEALTNTKKTNTYE